MKCFGGGVMGVYWVGCFWQGDTVREGAGFGDNQIKITAGRLEVKF